MNELLMRQLAIDFCCRPEDVADSVNHFTLFEPLDGRRQFQTGSEGLLKIAAINGKLLFSGQREILEWCESRFKETESAWFFEAPRMRELDRELVKYGAQIETAHPFFIPAECDVRNIRENSDRNVGKNSESQKNPTTSLSYMLVWYEREEIEAFRGDERFEEAFAFCPEAPDVIGLAAFRDGQILGMAGASADSPLMWQIGVDVRPEGRGQGLGKLLVARMSQEILSRGHLPFYGTSMSHILSQRVALGAGFVPAWAELAVSRIQS